MLICNFVWKKEEEKKSPSWRSRPNVVDGRVGAGAKTAPFCPQSPARWGGGRLMIMMAQHDWCSRPTRRWLRSMSRSGYVPTPGRGGSACPMSCNGQLAQSRFAPFFASYKPAPHRFCTATPSRPLTLPLPNTISSLTRQHHTTPFRQFWTCNKLKDHYAATAFSQPVSANSSLCCLLT